MLSVHRRVRDHRTRRLSVEDHSESIRRRLFKHRRVVHLLRALTHLFCGSGAVARSQPGAVLASDGALQRDPQSIGLLTIAVVALELGQTILEEEVLREAQVSAPTRVRRFLSRFMVVIVVALSIETVVAVFEFATRTQPGCRRPRLSGSRRACCWRHGESSSD